MNQEQYEAKQSYALIYINRKNLQAKIPLEVHRIEKDYAVLKKTQFPPAACVNDVFRVEIPNPAPVLIIRIYTVDGGIFLGMHLHHAIGDGRSLNNLITWLTAQTRGDKYEFGPLNLSPPIDEAELPRLDGTPPTFPEREVNATEGETRQACVVKDFYLDLRKIEMIRGYIGKKWEFTTMTIVSALTWAHATKARYGAFQGDNELEDEARILYIMDGRNALGVGAEEYFGNLVEINTKKHPLSTLVESCGDASTKTNPDTEDDWKAMAERLMPVLRSIQECVNDLKKEYVLKRYAQYGQLLSRPEPQKPKLSFSFGKTTDFLMNTWRHLGMNEKQKWKLLDDSEPVYPDALCRGVSDIDCPSAMVMPVVPDGPEKESLIRLMIVLEKNAMKLLMKDEVFQSMVSKVVE
ncbi:hypothetical protein F5Y17DRAFT_59755 [Xylariaceae sp. FL0594]|nr:hypothetical protein F5Y17DRAFT_59755 [Xylariaceae sp. FL0594]